MNNILEETAFFLIRGVKKKRERKYKIIMETLEKEMQEEISPNDRDHIYLEKNITDASLTFHQ